MDQFHPGRSPALWEKVSEFLERPTLAKEIIDAAKSLHEKRSKSPESKKIEDKIKSIDSQIEVLAERLSELPKFVSATPIYRQMERLETAKQEELKRLSTFKTENPAIDLPIAFNGYQAFVNSLKTLQSGPQREGTQEKIIRAMVHQVKITPNGFKAAFYVGKDYIEAERAKMAGPASSNTNLKKISLVSGSTSLTNGGSCSGTNELMPLTVRLVHPEKWTRNKVDLLELVTLRETGLTWQEIALQCGRSRATLTRMLKQWKDDNKCN